MKSLRALLLVVLLPLPAIAGDVSSWFGKAPAWPSTVTAADACAKQLETLNAQLEKEVMTVAQQMPAYGSGTPNTTSPAYAQATQLIGELMQCRPQTMTSALALQGAQGLLDEKLAAVDAERKQQLEKKCTRSGGEMSYIDEACQKSVDAEYNDKAGKLAETWLAERSKLFADTERPVKACIAKGDTARSAGAKAGLANTPFAAAMEAGSDLGSALGLLKMQHEHCQAAAATKARYNAQN